VVNATRAKRPSDLTQSAEAGFFIGELFVEVVDRLRDLYEAVLPKELAQQLPLTRDDSVLC